MADPEKAANALAGLSRQGFSIHLDDFGTGYSALMHLQNMPIKALGLCQYVLQPRGNIIEFLHAHIVLHGVAFPGRIKAIIF